MQKPHQYNVLGFSFLPQRYYPLSSDKIVISVGRFLHRPTDSYDSHSPDGEETARRGFDNLSPESEYILTLIVFVLGCAIFLFSHTFFVNTLFAQTSANVSIPTPTRGSIRHFANVPSAFVQPRNVDVWLPDGYNPRSRERYAVLYMHDGQMLFDSAITWNKQEWRVDETLAQLLQKKTMRKCIVIGIWNTGATRHSEYFPGKVFRTLSQEMQDTLLRAALQNKVQSDAYLKFIVNELKPLIDSTFATKSDVNNTFIAGSSMGGLISLYALCEYPHIFGGAACLSTHWVGNIRWQNGVIPRAIADYLVQYLPKPAQNGIRHKIYFDYGTATLDSLYKPHQIMVDSIMRTKGYSSQQWITRAFPGEDHSERAWAKRFAIPATFLLTRNFRTKF
jgi:predicted alpha/beta superfamily hydrolase